MLLIGSQALRMQCLRLDRKIGDTDNICTFSEFQRWCKEHKGIIARCVPLSDKTFHVRDNQGWNFEFEIAWPGSTGEALLKRHNGEGIATLEECLMLKESHKYLKNSPHFLKTMEDIHMLRKLVPNGLSDELQALLLQREKETYTYAHPKLDQSKEGFFSGDGVQYVYDHDSIHLTVALMTKYTDSPDMTQAELERVPAYTRYIQDEAEVMTSREKFESLPYEIQLAGVYEETCVLALERSQIPYGLGKEGGPSPRKSFEMALEKVCTSITSGWFRAWAYDHYTDVMALYEQLGEDDYVVRFKCNQHLLKPHRG